MKDLALLIKKALQLPNAEVKDIQKMGGMTNLNYLVTINGENYIVRVPGKGTEDFINREEERANLNLSSRLGINPELLYCNVETGLKITKKIVDAKTVTPSLAKKEETMEKVAAIFQKLHNANVKMANRFELFNLMEKYEKLAVDANADFFEGFKEVKEAVMSLKQHYGTLGVEEVPCHIDPACGNFILGPEEKLYLIDWEYSGMFDPFWDLAAHSMESGFSKTEENLFLTTYFQRDITKEEAQRILMHQIFQDYLWSLWTLFKEARGDDFGAYGINRFERVQENIALFQSEFCER